MKRLRSYGDDLVTEGEKEVDRTTTSFSSSSHHRRFYPKLPENGRRRPSPAAIDDDRDREGSVSRGVTFRKRGDHEFSDGFDDREGSKGGFRKRLDHVNDAGSGGFDRRNRYRDGSASSLVSPRGGYGVERERERDRGRERERDRERIHRSESFCMSRREFPKGFRSERNWSRRDDGGSGGGGLSSWRRFEFRNKKDVDEDVKSERGGSSSSKGGADGGGGGGGGATSSRESLRSPRRVKDVKSPTWSRDSTKESKDSVGEPSRDNKKSESMVAESAGSGGGSGGGSGNRCASEMEEGELQPESLQVPTPERVSVPKQEVENVAECDDKDGVDRDAVNESCDEFKPSQMVEQSAGTTTTDRKLSRDDEKEPSKEVVGDGKQFSMVDVAKADSVKGTEKSSSCQSESSVKDSVCEEVKVSADKGSEAAAANDEHLRVNQPECSGPSSFRLESQHEVKVLDQTTIDKSLPENEKPKNEFDLEVGLEESNKVILEEVGKEDEQSLHVVKDKGKGVAVCSLDEVGLREDNLLIERNFIACRDDAMEGPSTRGFELFSSSAGIKLDSVNRIGGTKSDAEKLKLEPLDLSLGLPNVSAPIASNSAAVPPSSPPRARSVQSFGTTLRTSSDCFTTSISFSGSQFIHNPSCSLTHNSVDYDFEQSVKSRPLFQGVDWQALSANDSLPKELPSSQKLMSNANGALQLSHASQGVLNGRPIQGQQGTPSGIDRSTSLQRQVSGKVRYQDGLRSPALSAGSHDTRSEYSKDRNRGTGEGSVSRLFRSNSQRELEQGPVGERDLVGRIIYLIVSEPIQAMAWRVHELPERSVAGLKESTCEILVKEDNKGKLRALQEVLRKRSDLNLETLLKSHRVQLQILVAIKTGLPDFLQRADSISSSDLAEIFLGLKCRNRNCRGALPVDECDCRFCSQKDGFCSSCMCLVCSKFDTASNTCGWVGCDFCNHWCHTDCGLLKSYIRNGRTASGAQGFSEMHFHCLACEHPSEMFGFVKDVFNTCAAEWKAETLLKELEYVKRIFGASNDGRGKLLHDVVKQLLVRLQSGANAGEICSQILGILNDNSKLGNIVGSSGRELQPQPVEKNRRDLTNGVAALSQEPIWSKPISTKDSSRAENVGVSVPKIDGNSSSWNTKTTPVVDELDSIIKIKQAEAQMFQKRADDARREAEGLKRIAVSRSEKIDEEYTTHIAKLRLSEVEERRRQKLEELQMLERSHREYFNMKTRMETDIKDLLLKMEATRRNLST